MHYSYRNVNDAFTGLVQGVLRGSIMVSKQSSRNGTVLRIPGPVTITYYRPTERVLFNTVRDSNPFFHLFESLWMLAGRNDVAPLKFFVDTIVDFSDDGETFNGAYGYRWRHHAASHVESFNTEQQERFRTDFDQLEHLVAHLKSNPESRRAVLTMWNVQDDLLRVDNSLGRFSKDTACNLSVVFEVNQTTEIPQLEMTVFNRSNDMIWGMFGANVVHFSFLQEYMAARLGVEVGHYHQISTNLHIYTERWLGKAYLERGTMFLSPDYRQPKKLVPLVQNAEVFDVENKLFIDNFLGLYTEPFLATVAQPMCRAYNYHKTTRDYGNAFKEMELVASEDWKIAGVAWLKKREANWKLKQLKQDKENGKETTGS